MTDAERHAQLYRWFHIACKLGALKSIWMQYDRNMIATTGSRPMTPAE